MSKRPLATVGDETPQVQLATMVPQALHRRLKCEAIEREVPLRALIATLLEAGLKATRA
jgi:hypothetical protein